MLDKIEVKMTHVEIVGVHPVDGPEPCHLVELIIYDCEGEVDLSGFTQEDPGQPRDNWQVPYLEHYLNTEGTSVLADDQSILDKPELWNGDVRLAFFFHYLDQKRPLETPFGDIIVPEETFRPDRLQIIQYESVD
jgi:hypothetical protein